MVTVINILLILVALVLIVCVLMQEGNRAGLGAIGGGAETFFGKSKAKGMEEKLALITKIGVLVFIVLAITCTILSAQQMKQEESAAGDSIALEDVVTAEDSAAGEADTAGETTAEDPAAGEADTAGETTAEDPAAGEAGTAGETTGGDAAA